MIRKIFFSGLMAVTLCTQGLGQNFLKVSTDNYMQTIDLDTNQILEIRLPWEPSTGYSWYQTAPAGNNYVEQTGESKFEPIPSSGKVVQAGYQVIQFKGSSTGSCDLNFEYRRIWEKNIPASDNFKITIHSKGKYKGNYIPPVAINKSATVQPSVYNTSTLSSLPSTFSWQPQCSPVKDQSHCGCCWAEAAVSSFEAIINMIDSKMTDQSVQWIINCINDTSNYKGCNGGTCPFDFMKKHGVVYESDLPFADANYDTTYALWGIGHCGTYPHHESIENWRYLGGHNNYGQSPVDSIKTALYYNGPLWNCFYENHVFQSYKPGTIFMQDLLGPDTSTTHCVAIVGWKDTTLSNGSSGYWICKNSWSSGFGNDGYFNIAYGVSLIGCWPACIYYHGDFPNCNTTLSSPSTTGTYLDKCNIFLKPGFQSNGSFQAKVVP